MNATVFEGRVDINRAAPLAQWMLSSITPADAVAFDLSEVTSVDTAATQVLVAARKLCQERGVSCEFRLSDPVRSFLSFIGVTL